MNEDKLAESLHDSFSAVEIGPAPLQRMHADARRIRRTRFSAVSAAAVAAVAVAGIGTWSAFSDGDAAEDLAPAAPTAPAGFRFVGVDGVVVAVPDSWVLTEGADSDYCGSESSDVVAYNAADCSKSNQDAVHFLRQRPDVSGWKRIEIDGEPARRSEVRVSFDQAGDGEPTVWTSQVYVDDIVVSAISSRSAGDVRALLDSVELAPTAQ